MLYSTVADVERPPAGGNVTVSLNSKVIGTGAFSPKAQSTHRRKLTHIWMLLGYATKCKC